MGLGNPGADYAGTRHNVGFAVVHRLADRANAKRLEKTRTYEAWNAGPFVLLTPLTYMNRSGDALLEFAERHADEGPAEFLIVVDDVYLPLGTLRLRARGSTGGHNGLESVQDALGSDAFSRLRIGIGRGDQNVVLAEHVLSRFEPDEEKVLDETLARACEAALTWTSDGIVTAMNRFNVQLREERDNAPEGER